MMSNAPANKKIKTVLEIVLAAVGGVIGVLITGVLGTSQGAQLAGAAFGAAVPALITALVRYRAWLAALTAAAGVTAAAVALLYVSDSIATYANADNDPAEQHQPIFPPLPWMPTIPASTTPTPDGHYPRSGIKVEPISLKCTVNGCDKPVTITSTGTKPLQLGKIKFAGSAAKSFKHDGKCQDQTLQAGEKCAVNVRFAPTGAPGKQEAQLVINQNAGGPKFVDLMGDAPVDKDPLTIKSINATKGSGRCLVYVVAEVSSPKDSNVSITGNANYMVGNQSFDTPLTLSPYPAGGSSAYRNKGEITLLGGPDELKVGLIAKNGAGEEAKLTRIIPLGNLC